MHSPFPFSWTATTSSFSATYQPLDESSISDTILQEETSSSTYANHDRTGLLSPVDNDSWSTFNFPSSPQPDDNEFQPGAPSYSAPSTLLEPLTAFVPLSSSSSPHVTPSIRHLRLQSDLSIFPNPSAQSSFAPSAATTPQRSSPGSPTVAAFLANPELLPKLLGRGKHQTPLVSLQHAHRRHALFAVVYSLPLYSMFRW